MDDRIVLDVLVLADESVVGVHTDLDGGCWSVDGFPATSDQTAALNAAMAAGQVQFAGWSFGLTRMVELTDAGVLAADSLIRAGV